MPTHPTILRHRVRRAAAVAAGVATLGAASLLTSFPAMASAKPAAASMGPATIMVVHNKTWGSLLALSNGDTVYRFTLDTKDHSKCTGKCAQIWPPVELAAGQKHPIGKGVSHLGTIKRAGGAKQVTYKGIPLYRFIGDKAPHQVHGNIKDAFGQWWSVNPANPTAIPTMLHSAAGASAGKQPTDTSGSNSSGNSNSGSSSSGGAAF
ncbi:MAG: hypothetical protein FWC87_15040 [Acidimicrobiaceae bacterium]|nr:hypothetical protein [Acidimicrobiaceae bacterium]